MYYVLLKVTNNIYNNTSSKFSGTKRLNHFYCTSPFVISPIINIGFTFEIRKFFMV